MERKTNLYVSSSGGHKCVLMGGAETVRGDSIEPEALRQHVLALTSSLIEQNIPLENIASTLFHVELLKANWSSVEAILKQILDGELT